METPQPSKNQEVRPVLENQNQPNDNERRQSIKAWVDEQEKMKGEERGKMELKDVEEEQDHNKVDQTRARRKRNEAAEANRREKTSPQNIVLQSENCILRSMKI